jgi:tetratricopeptide (TPR) repeat protein
MVQVLENNLEQIKDKLAEMRTSLNKANYLESAFKRDLSIDVKRFILNQLTEIYQNDRMYSKAAKAMSNKARFDPTFKDRIVSYLKSAELFCVVGSIEDAEEMFNRAVREANEIEKRKILTQRKEMYLNSAEKLEKQGKRSHAMKFYEKLITMKLEISEKENVKEKIIKNYKLLGRFKDAEMISRI